MGKLTSLVEHLSDEHQFHIGQFRFLELSTLQEESNIQRPQQRLSAIMRCLYVIAQTKVNLGAANQSAYSQS